MNRILITGANGQVGQILSKALSNLAQTQVYNTDIHTSEHCVFLDVLDYQAVLDFVQKNHITQIYHLAAILSAKGEQDPLKTWHINMQGLFNILEAAKNFKLDKVFFPSSIAVFGQGVTQELTPNYAALHPTTVYGMSKASGENWCQYYYQKHGLDVRSLRYPGVIGWQTMPGGGTTDYAIDIFHQLLKTANYTCFLSPNRCLPMLYMNDAIRATIEFMQAPTENIRIRSGYNIAGCSFTPEQIFTCIQSHIAEYHTHFIAKDLHISYVPDFRDKIAQSWPYSIDDSHAQKDWGWKAQFNLDAIVQDMLRNCIKFT
jgi:threonine 3-dehydrogenase